MTLNVSVVISTHDRPGGLGQAIDSVLAQSHPPYELIVVDDGREAARPQLAEAAAKLGGRLRYHRQQSPSLTRSRNQGMAMARGDVLLLLDDDVTLPPDYLRRLAALYQADRDGRIAGIGGMLVQAGRRPLPARAWDAVAAAFGPCRWSPRPCAARRVALPPALRGKLTPAWRLYGGAISLRLAVAKSTRFDESLTGYALGEDLEFSFRAGKAHAFFLATALQARHEPGAAGRPEMHARGRMYLANCIHILTRSADPGAGSYALLLYDFTGTILRYLLWGLLGRSGRNLQFALGMLRELARQAALAARKLLCGS